MARKKKDDFNQIPQPISSQKPGDLLSQGRKRKLLDIPGDACDVKIGNISNLDIIKTKGRVTGELITYDADNIYNYQSQSQRYDKSIGLIPAYVNATEESTIYGFCSHNSPKGFWEVVLGKGGIATFIDLSPNFLTILCPRPFFLDELLEIDSDSPSFLFTQIAGNRTVIIEPNNIKYPLFNIQSTCFTDTCDSSTTSPLIIRIETNNPLVFTDLVILNRAIDNFDGQGFASIPDNAISGRKVTNLQRVPDDLQRVYLWMGTDLIFTWSNPTVDSEFITKFTIQRLVPPYTDIDTILITDNRVTTLSPNERYRIETAFLIFGSPTTTISDPVFFSYPTPNVKTLFADDSGSSLGYAFITSNYVTVNFGNKLVNEIDINDVGIGYTYISNTYNTVNFGVRVVIESDDNDIGIGFAFNASTYTKIDLGGVIVG